MGQILSRSNRRKKKAEKDNFFEKLTEFSQRLSSFNNIFQYSTMDYRMHYAKIILRETDPNMENDRSLIKQYLDTEEMRRECWNVEIL